MKYQYGEYDGQPFQGPDALFPNPKMMQFIMQYGQQALDAMQHLMDQGDEDAIQQMIDAGLLEQEQTGDGMGEGDDDASGGQLKLTPKMVKGLQHKALLEIFEDMNRGNKEGHPTEQPGRSSERTEGTKTYEFGDPLSEIDLAQTMRNALTRHNDQPQPGRPASVPPIPIQSGDFQIHLTEGMADCATVLLIDQSGSMMRWGRFYQAKRVALGMQAMIQSRFPQDAIDYVGFYTLSERIPEREMPLVMPKPVSIRDYNVRLRMPLSQARSDEQRLPLHFTNLQLGLRQARQLLMRHSAANRQIFVITDGQPTAHVEPAGEATGGGETGLGEEMLYLLYPPNERTATATLQEALKCQQAGIRIATFALIEDYWGMDWVSFVERLTRLTRGIAYYCTSEDLSSTVIESYLSGKKKKSFVH